MNDRPNFEFLNGGANQNLRPDEGDVAQPVGHSPRTGHHYHEQNYQSKVVLCYTLALLAYVCGGILFSIPAVIIAHGERKRMRRLRIVEGQGLITSALVLGYINIFATVLLIMGFCFAMLAASGQANNGSADANRTFRQEQSRQQRDSQNRHQSRTTPTPNTNANSTRQLPAGFQAPPLPANPEDRWLVQLKERERNEFRIAMSEIIAAGSVTKSEQLANAVAPYTKDSSFVTRKSAIECIAICNWPEQNQLITQALTDESLAVRWKTLELIGDFPSTENAEALVQVFANERRADNALIKMGEIAEPSVMNLCTHQDDGVRIRAIRILAKIGTGKSIVFLDPMAKDSNGGIAAETQTAIDVIRLRLGITGDFTREQMVGASSPVQLQAIATLEDQLKQDNALSKELLAKLSDIGTTKAAELLVANFEKDPDKIAQALIEMGEVAETPCWSLLRNKDLSTQKHGCNILEKIGTKRSFEKLHSLWAESASPEIREVARKSAMVVTQ